MKFPCRFYLCLQIRNDILANRLPCSKVTQALLASYLVQSQFGDYDSVAHSIAGKVPLYLEPFTFAPNQTKDMLRDICELHKMHKYIHMYRYLIFGMIIFIL